MWLLCTFPIHYWWNRLEMIGIAAGRTEAKVVEVIAILDWPNEGFPHHSMNGLHSTSVLYTPIALVMCCPSPEPTIT